MFDPGAMGTLIIGLRANGIELDFGEDDDTRRRGASRQWHVRAHVARAMRRLADRLEPTPLEPELAS